jgi:hypothetical protein
MRRTVLICSAVVALAACGVSAAGTAPGAFGKVTRGPISPVCSAEQPCTEPAVGAVIVFLRSGVQAGRAVVGAAGTYRIHLAPGLYTVRAGRRVAPTTVRIRPGRLTHADLSIDTGIR